MALARGVDRHRLREWCHSSVIFIGSHEPSHANRPDASRTSTVTVGIGRCGERAQKETRSVPAAATGRPSEADAAGGADRELRALPTAVRRVRRGSGWFCR